MVPDYNKIIDNTCTFISPSKLMQRMQTFRKQLAFYASVVNCHMHVQFKKGFLRIHFSSKALHGLKFGFQLYLNWNLVSNKLHWKYTYMHSATRKEVPYGTLLNIWFIKICCNELTADVNDLNAPLSSTVQHVCWPVALKTNKTRLHNKAWPWPPPLRTLSLVVRYL